MAKVGRPPKPQGMKHVQITLYLPPNLVASMNQQATSTGTKMQDLIRRYLEDGLQRDIHLQVAQHVTPLPDAIPCPSLEPSVEA